MSVLSTRAVPESAEFADNVAGHAELEKSLREIVARTALGGSGVVGRGLLDLGAVGLPAGVGVGVLLLPLLALSLEALEPLVGLGVEALGVLVVALLVVLGGHAVQRRVELADRDAAVVGLLQRQRDPAPVDDAGAGRLRGGDG